jgi:hypothetical protein
MDMNVTAALGSYAYQSTLTQTGSANRALAQAMASGQSQASEVGSLVASAGSFDPLASLAGGSNSEALTSLAYATSAASGTGAQSVQAALASLGNGTSAILSSLSSSGSDGLPLSAAALSPSTTEALVRYAYDQGQSQSQGLGTSATAQQAAASGLQTLMSSSLNLLA